MWSPNLKSMLVAAGLLSLAEPTKATTHEYICKMTSRSTIEENMSLSDHGLRVIAVADGYSVQERMGDGTWIGAQGYSVSVGDDFAVFQRVPHIGEDLEFVAMLTVHHSGRASFLVHHGSFGNSSQYEKGWMTQGVCEPMARP